jgi:transcriptional regulator with XRE-family HTH domain
VGWAETYDVLMTKKKSLAVRIGNQIKKLRLKRRMSQFDLAEKAGIGISYISKIEQGGRFPSIKTSLRIAKALNVELGEIFTFGDPAMEIERPSKEYLELLTVLQNLPHDDVKLLLELARRLETRQIG